MKANFGQFTNRNEYKETRDFSINLFNNTLNAFHDCVLKMIGNGLSLNLAFCKAVSEAMPSFEKDELIRHYCKDLSEEQIEVHVQLYSSITLVVFDNYLELIKSDGNNVSTYKSLKGSFNENEGLFKIITK